MGMSLYPYYLRYSANRDGVQPFWKHYEIFFEKKALIPALQQLLISPEYNNKWLEFESCKVDDRLLKEVAPRAPRRNRGSQFVVPKCRRSCSEPGSRHHFVASYFGQPTHLYFHPLWWHLESDMAVRDASILPGKSTSCPVFLSWADNPVFPL